MAYNPEINYNQARNNILKDFSKTSQEILAIKALVWQECMRADDVWRKIEAIKNWRTATGAGLKEAKDYVEMIHEMFYPSAASPPPVSPIYVTAQELNELRRYVDNEMSIIRRDVEIVTRDVAGIREDL